jgi:hypothetical protein
VSGNYKQLLARLHEHLQPRTYLEIGVLNGETLALARPGTKAIGIDPAPDVQCTLSPATEIVVETSDDFFAQYDVTKKMADQPIDFAFIDGMHLIEFALRDFINVERFCARGSVVAIHDCLPPDAEIASREHTGFLWAGDVWKLMVCLNEHRPDLDMVIVDVPPTGLGLVTDLDPTSTVLHDHYDAVCTELVPLAFEDGAIRRNALRVVPDRWSDVVGAL